MDYKKTNAPATTVTRDMMELCADIWKKCLKIESKSKFLVIMRNCRNRT